MRLSGYIIAILFGAAAAAQPVPYKEAVALSTFIQPFQTDSSIAYGFKRNLAIAARIMTFDDRIGQMNFYAPQLNVLLKRWNGDGFQANNYAFFAVGTMVYNKHEHGAVLTALHADAESRRLYISGKAEKMWTGIGSDFWHLRSRVGVAPYKAGFNQLATWLMVEHDYNPLLRGWQKVTPLVRMFYKNYLWETGVSTEGEFMFNFMVQI